VNTVTVTNNGTFIRSTSSGSLQLYNVVFTNTSPGTVQAQSGTLDFSTAGSSTSTGSFSVSAGATIDFGGSATRTISGAITGGGAVIFSQGTTTLTGTYTIGNTTLSGGVTVNFNQGSTVTLANLTMSNGTLAGSANINITTLLDMNSGTMAGGGTTTLANGATGTFDSSYLQLTRPFVNNGDITLSASGAYFYMNTGGTFTNSSTGSVDIQHNGTYAFYGLVNTVPVVNTGSILRSTNSNSVQMYNVVFTNTSPGSVQVQTGTLELNTSGSSTNTGAFTVSGGATIEFGGSATRTVSGAVTGGGAVNFTAATTTLTGTYSISNTTISGGATVNFNQGSTQNFANLSLNNGTLAGSANVNITTLLHVTSGTMTGGGTTTLANGATGTFDSSYMTLTRPFVNNGDITLTANGAYFYMNTGGTFTNSSTGSVDIQHNGTWAWYGLVNTAPVVNTGAILRTTNAGPVQIYNVVLTNTSPGSIQVQSGSLILSTAGTSSNTGAFSVSGGTTLEFGGSATRNISGAISGTGAVEFSGGTTNLTGTYSISNTTVTGGTVNFNQGTAQSLANVTLGPGSGTLSGTAAINITTQLDANSGTLAGAGTMTLVNGATGVLDSSSVSLTRPFVNHAAITMSGSGYFSLNTGGSFTNSSDATVEVQGNTYAFYGGVAGLVLSNAGSITRTTGSSTAYINNLNFTNTGIVESQSGTFDIYPYTQTNGQTILSGGNFDTSGTTWNINGGILKGNGTITGNVQNAANVSPGLSPGTITITGNYTQTAAGTLTIEQNGTTPGSGFDQLVVTGTVTLAGTIVINTQTQPSVTTSYTIISNGGVDAVSGTFTGAPEGTVLVTPPDNPVGSLGGNYRLSYKQGDGNDVVMTFLTKTAYNTIQPCRIGDTRNTLAPSLAAGSTRTFVIAGHCGIPLEAQAASFNFTVVGPTTAGNLRIFPGGAALPTVSSINYSAGQVRANNAIILLGPDGDISVQTGQANGSVNLIIDVSGYFQ
jgi:hypothetical protein